MYLLLVYSITGSLWRWGIWSGGALRRCGTASTKWAAAMHIMMLPLPEVRLELAQLARDQ
jgi:hypothetical protein